MSSTPVSKSSIPDAEAIGSALLAVLKSGRQKSIAAAEKETASLLGMSPAEKRYRIKGSATTLFENRFKKARAELHSAGLIELTAPDKMKLTEAGKARLRTLEDNKGASRAGNPEKAGGGRHARLQDSDDPALYRPPSAGPALHETPAADAGETGDAPWRFVPPDPADKRAPADRASAVSGARHGRMPDAEQTEAFSFVRLPARSSETKKALGLLPLILAIVAIVLCATGALAPLGILCGIASAATLVAMKKNDAHAQAPRASIALSAVSVFAGIVIALGAMAPAPNTPAPDEPPNASRPASTQAASSDKATPIEKEAAELSFTVSAPDWSSKGKSVTVYVTHADKNGEDAIDYYEAKPGLTYTLDYKKGSYSFAIDTDALSDGETLYKAEPVSYAFDGKKSHVVTLALAQDTEAMERMQAEKEEAARIEAERQKAEDEAAAAAAAEAEAAAAAAAAATNNAPDTGGGTVYITETGAKYHANGCQYLKKSKIAISKSDAINQGYGACSKCNP